MQDRPALICWRRLANRRGAVVLLAVYFMSLLLLILGGLSLQRTTIESRAAQVSRNNQQAFFLAEGALDRAIAQSRTSTLYDGITYEVPNLPANSRATYQLFTEDAEIMTPATQRLMRRIEAVGVAASGATATVSASIAEDSPLSGVWIEGPLWISGGGGPYYGEPVRGILHGNLRSGLGIERSVYLRNHLRLDGSVQVAPSGETEEFFNAFVPFGACGLGPSTVSFAQYSTLIGPGTFPAVEDHGRPYGVALVDYRSSREGQREWPIVEGTGYALPPHPFPRVSDYTSAHPSCQGALEVFSVSDVRINDGDPRDLHNTRGAGVPDGRIELCFQYVNITGAAHFQPPGLLLDAPGTVYVTSSKPPETTNPDRALFDNPVNRELGMTVPADRAISFAAGDVIAVDRMGHAYPDGVKIISTHVDANPSTVVSMVSVRPHRFSGSIYAPDAYVTVGVQHGAAEVKIGSLVGREAELYVGQADVAVDAHLTRNSAVNVSEQAKPAITSWMSQ